MLFVGNKIDLLSKNKLGEDCPLQAAPRIKKISAEKGIGLQDLKKEIFDLLGIVRVYTKGQNKEPDFEHPFTFKKGGRLIDLANQVHQDLAQRFKSAKLFKKDSDKKPIIVGKDYLLQDNDIIEIHT